MLIEILSLLVFLALLVYLGVQIFGRRSPRRIAEKELERELKRREQRKENLNRIQRQVERRSQGLARAVKEVVDALGPDSGVTCEVHDGIVYVHAGEESCSAVFRLTEYDLDAVSLDVDDYADRYGKYILEHGGEKSEYGSLEDVVRFFARTLARRAGG